MSAAQSRCSILSKDCLITQIVCIWFEMGDVLVGCRVTRINWSQFNQIGMVMKQLCAQEVRTTYNNNTSEMSDDSNVMMQTNRIRAFQSDQGSK